MLTWAKAMGVPVVLWTGFTGEFAAAVTTLHLPLTPVAFGMIARGAAFAYLKSVTAPAVRRVLRMVRACLAAVFRCADARREGEVALAEAFHLRAFVTAIAVGWAVGQYPYVLLPGLTIEQAAQGRATLMALLVALALGAVVLIPALVFLYTLFRRPTSDDPAE